MSVVQETTLKALPLTGVEVSFGTLSPNFDYLDVYVDPTNAQGSGRIMWRLYATLPGAAPDLVVQSLPVPSNQGPYLPFASIQMVAGTTYEIKAVAVDTPCPAIVAGFAGSDAQVNTGVPDVMTGSHKLVANMETVFATIPIFHTQFQVQVDPNGSVGTASTWTLYGIITGAGGTIRAQIAVGQFGESSGNVRPYIVISTANDPLGKPLGRARGAGSYQITGLSLNGAGSSGPMNATLAGFDANLDIAGGVPPAVTAFAAGIIYQPVIGPPPPPVGNLFHVWGPGAGTVMGALAQTQGNVEIEIDDSIVSPAPIPSAGMPVGGWDMQGRVRFTNANPGAEVATVNILNGATLLNLVGWSQVNVEGAPLLAPNLPALSYTKSLFVFMDKGSQLIGFAGTRPLVDIAANTVLVFEASGPVLFETGLAGTEIFNLLAPSSALGLALIGGANIAPALNMVAGPGTLFFDRDAASGTFLVNAARFTGAVNFGLLEGPEQKQQIILTGAVIHVVDAAAIATGSVPYDELIFCKTTIGVLTVQLPDATLQMNKGRVIRIVDDNGNSGVNPISLMPFAGQTLNGGLVPIALSAPWNTWEAKCDGAQWTVNIDNDATVNTANNAFASGIIFRPGAAQVDNVFPVWGGPFPSVMGAFALTHGNVTIEIDDSVLPAASVVPVGVNDLQGRATLVGSNPNNQATLTIPDGAQLLNLSGWTNLIVKCNRTASPLLPLKFSLNNAPPLLPIQLAEFAQLINTGTLPAVDVQATFLFFFCIEFSVIQGNGVGAEVFSVPVGKTLALRMFAASRFAPPQNIATGAGTFQLVRDTTSGTLLVNTAQFTGTVLPIGLQEGIESKNNVSVLANTTYVIDAAWATSGVTGADETIFCAPGVAGPLNVNLPDATLPMNKGRILRIVDHNGASGAFPINLVPTLGQTINGVAATLLLSTNWNIWEVQCDGAQWMVNVDTDTVTTANNAFAASIVYRPGGPNVDNVFNTWGGAFPSVMAAFALTHGPVTIAVDDTIVTPAPVPVGVYDLQGRATIVGAQGGNGFPTFDIAAGAQLVSVGFRGPMAVNTHGTVAVPSFVQNRATQDEMLCENNALFTHTGLGPWMAVPAAGFVDVTLRDECSFTNSAAGAGPMFALGAGASALLEAYEAPSFTVGANNLVTGAVGTSIQFNFDASWPGTPPPSPAFAGAPTVVLIDTTQGLQYNAANILPAPATFTSLAQPSAQTAIDAHRSPQRTVIANYAIDSAGFDQAIFSNAAAINITLPLSTNWPGREITVKDITNGILAPFYNLVPTAPDKIESVAAPFPQNTPLGSLVVKSDGAGNWWII